MKKRRKIYNLLHVGQVPEMGNFPDPINQTKLDQIRLLTVPIFTSTTGEEKKNSCGILLKHHNYRHEKERIFHKTDGFALEHLHFLKKTGEIEHERVQKFSKTAGFAPEIHEKISKTLENFPKTLRGGYGSHHYFSGSTGILSKRLQKLSERRGNFPERLRLVKGDRPKNIGGTLRQIRGCRKITGDTPKIIRDTQKSNRVSRNFNMKSCIFVGDSCIFPGDT